MFKLNCKCEEYDLIDLLRALESIENSAFMDFWKEIVNLIKQTAPSLQ